MNKKTALVTGATSGIGRASALRLKELGFTVYGAARRAGKLEELERLGIKTAELDVTDEASMAACVDGILKTEGRIDVLVNNAGYGSYGAIEDVPMAEARRQFEVNVFGLARMTQLVLPGMRANGSGRIINISSMAGKIHTPFGGWYHAAKFAVEALSDCLRLELAPFGIDVAVVEPGAIKTDWSAIACRNLKKTSSAGAYAAKAEKVAAGLERYYAGRHVSQPERIARAVGKAAAARRPRTRYLIGHGAKPSVFLKRLLPDRVFDRAIGKVLG